MNAIKIMILAVALLWSGLAIAQQGTYQTPEDFLDEVFNSVLPKPKVIWLKKGLKQDIEAILQDSYTHPGLRVRYWGNQGRTAWILEAIGKTHPITVGIVVNNSQLEQIKVLIFRESRGWEVRYPFFTDQFKQASFSEPCDPKLDTCELNRNIDGIAGATLSVRALKRLGRMALYLHQHTPFATHAQK